MLSINTTEFSDENASRDLISHHDSSCKYLTNLGQRRCLNSLSLLVNFSKDNSLNSCLIDITACSQQLIKLDVVLCASTTRVPLIPFVLEKTDVEVFR